MFPVPILVNSSNPPTPGNHWSIFCHHRTNLPLPELHINGILHMYCFVPCLFQSGSQHNVFKVCLCCCMYHSFSLMNNLLDRSAIIFSSTYLLIDMWVVSSLHYEKITSMNICVQVFAWIQAYLGEIASVVPDHSQKANIAIKQVR